MLTSGELLFQNSYFHNVGFPDFAKTWALNCVFSLKKKIQTLIADILKSQKYYMSFEKKPRHLAKFSLAKEHEYLKKNTIYLLQQFKGPTLWKEAH